MNRTEMVSLINRMIDNGKTIEDVLYYAKDCAEFLSDDAHIRSLCEKQIELNRIANEARSKSQAACPHPPQLQSYASYGSNYWGGREICRVCGFSKDVG